MFLCSCETQIFVFFPFIHLLVLLVNCKLEPCDIKRLIQGLHALKLLHIMCYITSILLSCVLRTLFKKLSLEKSIRKEEYK